MDRKLLITGGAGYVGSHSVHYLISKGISPEDIIVFDNLVYGNKEFLPEGVTLIKGDLLDQDLLKEVFDKYDFDAVMHFAAYAYVGESMENPGKYFINNILGGLNLLEEMHRKNVKKIIFSSSCATYGIYEHPITEEDIQNPINPYGESKFTFERILKWYDQIFGIKSVALRYFNVAGADFGIGENHIPEVHVIPLVVKTALGKRNDFYIFGADYPTEDGTCIRDYIHVTDIADAHYRALKYLDEGKTVFLNLGTGKGTSVQKIVNIVKQISGKDFNVVIEEKRKGDPSVLIAEYKKAKEVLGWEPTRSIEEAIKSAYEWEERKKE